MAKKISCISLTCLALFAGAVWGGVDIPATCRVKNQPPGRCGWCSLETLGRYHQLKALYQLSEKNATRCSINALETALNELGVAYRMQRCGIHSEDILGYAVSRGLGAAVGFRELHPGAGGHIVTLVDFTDDVVRVIDSNDQDCRVRQMTTDRFLYWWDGFAVVLEPKVLEPKQRQIETEMRARFSDLPLIIHPIPAAKSAVIVVDERPFNLQHAVPSR